MSSVERFGIALRQFGNDVQCFIDESVHPSIKATTGIDMDDVEARVHAAIPPFDFRNGCAFFVIGIVFWECVSYVAKRSTPHLCGLFGHRRKYEKMSPSKQRAVRWSVAAWFQCSLTVPAVLYGMVYADGTPGTSWFAEGDYWNTAFDYQKYFLVWMCSYFVGECVFMYASSAADDDEAVAARDLYLHHLTGVVGPVSGLYLGGWPLIQCYVVCLAEATNPCNNLRVILSEFGAARDSALWIANGAAWLIAYVWFRLLLFSYLLFTKIAMCVPGFVCPDYVSDHPEGGFDRVVLRVQQALSWVFYALNLYWTVLIVKGVLVACGVMKRSPKKRRDETKED